LKKGYLVTALIFLILLIDQAVKFYIKTNFEYNQDVPILGSDWARLHFVENEGMAFGITFEWKYGKLVLSLFRILLVTGLVYYIRLLLRAKAPTGFVVSVGLITAGAIGNIVDSAVYGLIFSASEYHGGVAQLMPWGQGYGSFLHGKVVDMLYFPIKWIHMPEWVPGIGGEEYLFFSPIFNIADASITSGVVAIIVFQRRFFSDGFVEEKQTETAVLTEPEAEELPEGSTAEQAETAEPTEQASEEMQQDATAEQAETESLDEDMVELQAETDGRPGDNLDAPEEFAENGQDNGEEAGQPSESKEEDRK
jgi:signal peptidase II